MIKNKNRFLAGFAAVAVAVFAVAVGLRVWQAGGGGAGDGAVAAPGGVQLAPPSDDKVVSSASGAYSIRVPENWYVEDVGASGTAAAAAPELAVYPDYDPATASASSATCKIEITEFAAPAAMRAGTAGLNDWITQYLHADPTAAVAEILRTQVTLGDAVGAPTAGIEWRGTMNNVTTTLVYAIAPEDDAAAPQAGKIFEIAPSTLSEAGDASNDDCDLDLQALVANFAITNYEP